MIAIEPAENLRFSAVFPIKEQNKGSLFIQAAPFCSHFGIRIDETLRFIEPEIRDGCLQLKLRETVVVRNMRRKKKDS